MLMDSLGIEDICDPSSILGVKPILVGGGTDGTLVNISQHKASRPDYCMDVFIAWMCLLHGCFRVGAVLTV